MVAKQHFKLNLLGYMILGGSLVIALLGFILHFGEKWGIFCPLKTQEKLLFVIFYTLWFGLVVLPLVENRGGAYYTNKKVLD